MGGFGMGRVGCTAVQCDVTTRARTTDRETDASSAATQVRPTAMPPPRRVSPPIRAGAGVRGRGRGGGGGEGGAGHPWSRRRRRRRRACSRSTAPSPPRRPRAPPTASGCRSRWSRPPPACSSCPPREWLSLPSSRPKVSFFAQQHFFFLFFSIFFISFLRKIEIQK